MGKAGRPQSRRSPLGFFEQACRSELRRRHPGAAVSGAALSRACAQRWQSTSAQERALFEHLAQGWRRAFKTRPTPARDPLAPKRPLTPFFIFSSEHRAQVRARWPGLNYAETAKRLGEHWTALSPEQRQPFEARAAALREAYRRALADYQSKGASSVPAPQGDLASPPAGPSPSTEAPLHRAQGNTPPTLGGSSQEHSSAAAIKEEADSDEGCKHPPLEELSEEESEEELADGGPPRSLDGGPPRSLGAGGAPRPHEAGLNEPQRA